jgi:thiazole synthase
MPEHSEIAIVVNGENVRKRAGLTVTELIGELGLQPGRVAIERNLQILPRPRWHETPIQDGDRLEIVQFVGGG